MPSSVSLRRYRGSSWPRRCSLKPFMLIKSNDFLQIQLAGEEPLDAKLIPTDRGSVCVKQHNHNNTQTRLSTVWLLHTNMMLWFTLAKAAYCTSFHQGHDIWPFTTWNSDCASQLTFHDLPHPQGAHILDQSFPKVISWTIQAPRKEIKLGLKLKPEPVQSVLRLQEKQV